MTQLSIIVPAYRVEAYIRACLLSCVHQDLPAEEYEVIVVDDGSPDASAAIVEEMMQAYPQIRLLRQTNQGLSMARNNGLKAAQGRYVWFVDSDDSIRENCLGGLLATIVKAQVDVMRIGATFEAEGMRGATTCEGIRTWQEMLNGADYEACVPFYWYSRRLLETMEPLFVAGLLHEDSEFTPRLLVKAQRAYTTTKTIYQVRQNGDSITHTANSKRSFDVLKICRMREEWMPQLAEEDQYIISRHISMNLNSAIRNIRICPKEEQRRFFKELSRQRSLLRHFRLSRNKKYQLEGVLLRLLIH